jgi:hypothetical protein
MQLPQARPIQFLGLFFTFSPQTLLTNTTTSESTGLNRKLLPQYQLTTLCYAHVND